MRGEQRQDDFRVGIVRSASRAKIPAAGLYDILNGLLVDDGLIWRRGGSTYYAGTQLRAGKPVYLAWDGELLAQIGHRTLVADYDPVGANTHYGVHNLAGDITDIGRARDATDAATDGPAASGLCANELGGLVFIDGGSMWGGSMKTADYAVGTVTVTNGSTTVVGVGTAWTANVDKGMILRRGTERGYVVVSVTDNTHLELAEPYQGVTGAGVAYKLLVLAAAPQHREHYAVVANRLVAMEGNKIEFSNGPDPATGLLRWHTFDPLDFHLLSEGARILGGTGLGDRLMVFTTLGVWAVSNMAYDLTDDAGNVQQTLEKVSDVVIWSKRGMALWDGQVIVPGQDGIWVFGSGPRTSLSLSVDGQLRSYLRQGYTLGQGAVIGNHYFLPIVGADVAATEIWVCRLDRPVRSGLGTIFPWARFTGTSMGPALVNAASGVSDRVLVSGQSAGWLVQLDPFKLDSAVQDFDGSAYPFEVTTRDFAPGELPVTFKGARVRYELTGAGTPNMQAYVSDGTTETQLVAPVTDGPASAGEVPVSWRTSRRARALRLRLRCDDAATKLNLRELALFSRIPGRR